MLDGADWREISYWNWDIIRLCHRRERIRNSRFENEVKRTEKQVNFPQEEAPYITDAYTCSMCKSQFSHHTEQHGGAMMDNIPFVNTSVNMYLYSVDSIERFARHFQKTYNCGLSEDNEMIRMLTEELRKELPNITHAKGQSTKEAFRELISKRAIHHELDIDSGSVRWYRSKIKEDSWPKESTMEEHLEKAGYSIVQHKLWDKGNV